MAELREMTKEKTKTMRTPIAANVLRALIASLFAMAFLTPSAMGAQAIEMFKVNTDSTQAGAHPNLNAEFRLADAGEPEIAKTITVDMPEGIFGNPNAIPNCLRSDFYLFECPLTAQAGVVTVRGNYEGDPEYLLGTSPIYMIDVQPEGETARLGFVAPIVNMPIVIPVTVRTGSDYGLRLTVEGITQTLPLASIDMTVWGFPSDDTQETGHSEERFRKGSPGNPSVCVEELNGRCGSQFGSIPRNTGLYPKPLIDNPSYCSGQTLPVDLTVETYGDPSNPTTATYEYPATTECELQKFDPVLNAGLTIDETDSPSGLDLQLRAPQPFSRAATPANIRSARVALPEGLTINPDAADGQSSCSDAQIGFGSDGPSRCPDNSKIGNFDIRTDALVGPLEGSLYIGEPQPGNQYRVFMVATGFGINAKLEVDLQLDQKTGQVTMFATDLPQVPFEEFNLHLFASDRGLMATPTHCTVYSLDSTYTSWNPLIAKQHSKPVISLTKGPDGRPCPAATRPFNPRLIAGMSTPVAGAFSKFHLKLDRDDGDQFLGDLNFKMPPGFTGYLKGISYCPEGAISEAATKLGRTEQANASCPSSSQVGTTNVAAGPGSHPFNAVGKMYLAGPFKGAPISLAAVTPALAGPYDYGTQVVRVALNVDPLTAQVKAISDKVPSIIGGVPIRMRSIQVNIDRESFTINPTNCENFSVDSQGIGDQGTTTDFSSPFHAVNCASLPFKPRMKVTQLDKKRAKTKRNANPRLRFELFTRPGDANIKSMLVTLPKAFQVDQRHLGNICSKAQLEAERCKGRQPIGTVMTKTPLLDDPLSGPAYAVSGFGKLPRLAFILAGQVTLVPQAESKSDDTGRLATTVPVVPDAPIGYFRLDLLGGKQGYLINTRDLCKGKVGIVVEYAAQSGKALQQRVKPKAPCGAGASRKAKRAARGGS